MTTARATTITMAQTLASAMTMYDHGDDDDVHDGDGDDRTQASSGAVSPSHNLEREPGHEARVRSQVPPSNASNPLGSRATSGA